jgi:hypothetical protein
MIPSSGSKVQNPNGRHNIACVYCSDPLGCRPRGFLVSAMVAGLARQYRLSLIVGLGVLATASGLWLWTHVRAYENTSFAQVSLRTGGRPLEAVVVVTDRQGRPVPSAPVKIDNTSGGDDATTDAAGRAVLKMGEPEVEGVEVLGRRVLDRPYAWYLETPNVRHGLRIEVRLK